MLLLVSILVFGLALFVDRAEQPFQQEVQVLGLRVPGDRSQGKQVIHFQQHVSTRSAF